ncbi:uncharacterized protein [Chelonus insularis]|uniref:uncharacterized protein isoform X2 n=1 Tax=Chelonus insularis TaxID=460826 RepID=UPI00158A4CE7|nr:uncharacterized protein LOC118073112 isoform X2 [Chelonus insularis]
MTSKVLVKLPTVPFSQGKKSAELMTLSARNEGVSTPVRSQQGINGERTAQLEQNIKFLQEQHQATLLSLHQEIESLRQRNRDLQFQLVFNKGTISATSSPSSPEDNSNGFIKPKIELLERDLEELKVSFNEAKKQNFQLQEVIENQKIKLEQAEKEKEKLPSTEAGIQVGEASEAVQNDLAARLEDAEALVKRLQRENADQQREIASMKASSAKNGNRNGHGRGRGNENGHHSRGSSGDPGQSNRNSYKFPPLENENYWRNVTRGRSSYERQSGPHRRNHPEKEDSEPTDMPCRIVLPELLNSNVKPDLPCYPPFYRSQRGYHSGGNYYRDGGNRKFRGQGRPRDRRDQDHRGDYRDRNSREQ